VRHPLMGCEALPLQSSSLCVSSRSPSVCATHTHVSLPVATSRPSSSADMARTTTNTVSNALPVEHEHRDQSVPDWPMTVDGVNNGGVPSVAAANGAAAIGAFNGGATATETVANGAQAAGNGAAGSIGVATHPTNVVPAAVGIGDVEQIVCIVDPNLYNLQRSIPKDTWYVEGQPAGCPSLTPPSLCSEMTVPFDNAPRDLYVGKCPGCSLSVIGAVLRRSINSTGWSQTLV